MSEENAFLYDVFVSYSHRDAEWVRGWLLLQLEAAGLKVCVDFRDFEPGATSIGEMERAVLASRKTLLVLTPAYVASEWTNFESTLARTLDPAARRQRVLPILRQNCEIPWRIRVLVYLDWTAPGQDEAQLKRLIAAIRVPTKGGENGG